MNILSIPPLRDTNAIPSSPAVRQPHALFFILSLAVACVVTGALMYMIHAQFTEEIMGYYEEIQRREANIMRDKRVNRFSIPVSGNGEKPQTQQNAIRAYHGRLLAGNASSPLLDFIESDYAAAIASGKLVALYFYATWCPICKDEVENALYPAFNELNDRRVIGFRVNYNDEDVDDAERALAREYGVAYQHTKVLIKNGARVLKSPEGWNKERYLMEIKKAL